MELEIDKTYLMLVDAGKRTLTYTGKITSIKNGFISFVEKFGKEIGFSLKNIISFEVVENGNWQSNGISK